MPDPAARNIITAPTPIDQIEQGTINNDVLVFCTFSRILHIDVNAPHRVKRRGRRLPGPTDAVSLLLEDDTGEIWARINGHKLKELGKEVLQRKPNQSLFAIKGAVLGHRNSDGKHFRMIFINDVHYLGELDDANRPADRTKRAITRDRTRWRDT
jgi:hypothetical protein